jgi:hypothetical protein
MISSVMTGPMPNVVARNRPSSPDQFTETMPPGRERLPLVVITIDGENPYEIFESLNSTGLPLEESDLICNFMFMQIAQPQQEEFNKKHWAPFEELFGDLEDDPKRMTTFYRNYLMRGGTYSKPKQTFVDFKEQHRLRTLTPEAQVDELKRFAKYQLILDGLTPCKSDALRKRLADIGMLEITTAYPLLLCLMDLHESGGLEEDELLGCLDDLASFVIRRSICAESTRNYNRWFPEAIPLIKNTPREDLRKQWLRRRWPDDATFIARLEEFSLYHREQKKCRLILEALEVSLGHKEKVDLSDPKIQIEHVMPRTIQADKFGKVWQADLGDGWQAVHDKWLHTLGNLTLTAYNQDFGNRPYTAKRTELIQSKLGLNQYFARVESWNVDAICSRGQALAKKVAAIWPRPTGGEYVPVTATEKLRLTPKERRDRRFQYWNDLLALLKKAAFIPKLPKSSPSGWLGINFGVKRFRLLAFANTGKRHIGVALACRGPEGKKHFRALREVKTAIEAEVGEHLLWEEMPKQKSAYIILRRTSTLLDDIAQWPDQHGWLASKLKVFVETFAGRCKSLAPIEVPAERYELRKRFWTALLEQASSRTDLHSGVLPSKRNWLGTGAGTGGLAYNYVLTRHGWVVELYIDRGKGRKSRNKRIFDALKAHHTAIEKAFGEQLSWERLDSKAGCRIAKRSDGGGYRDDESKWPAIHEAMIDAMIALEKATHPYILKLKEEPKD